MRFPIPAAIGVFLLFLQAPAVSSPADAVKEDLIVQSWQVDHPLSTGVLSALSLGLWPERFGDDAIRKPGSLLMNAGYGEVAFGYVRQGAEPIFLNTRTTVWSILVFLLVLLFIRSRLRRRKPS